MIKKDKDLALELIRKNIIEGIERHSLDLDISFVYCQFCKAKKLEIGYIDFTPELKGFSFSAVYSAYMEAVRMCCSDCFAVHRIIPFGLLTSMMLKAYETTYYSLLTLQNRAKMEQLKNGEISANDPSDNSPSSIFSQISRLAAQ